MVRPTKASTKKQIPVALDSQDLQSLQEISEETGRSLSSIIREAVKKYLKEHK